MKFEKVIRPKPLLKSVINRLTPLYDQEARDIAFLLFEHFFKTDKTRVIINDPLSISGKKWEQFKDAVDRLMNYEPVQYITGEAFFMGRRFRVSQEVLIPRQETEELVLWIKELNGYPEPRILDIGCGSGCIAISLGLEIKGAKITAWDINEKAIGICENNAQRYNLPVELNKIDLFNDPWPEKQRFEVIVSNPPYVRESEKIEMHKKVLNHEPAQALFVSDAEPLIFYERIMKKSREILIDGGFLFFEINESFGNAVKQRFLDYGFAEVAVKKDIHDKDRYAFGRRQNG